MFLLVDTASEIRKIAFLGDYWPRKCGIATFTSDLLAAVAAGAPRTECFSVPVNDLNGGYEIRRKFASKSRNRPWPAIVGGGFPQHQPAPRCH